MSLTTEADVRQRVRTPTETPWQLAEQLDGVRVAIAREKRRGAARALQVELDAIRDRLAQMFAERHGWRRSRSQFTPAVLARRGVRDGYGRGLEAWPYRLIDHPFFFRTPDRRAAALAAHIYGLGPETRDEMRAWAEPNGLCVVFPEDFPSWWVPGGTTLCVYLPAEEAPAPGDG